MMKQQQKSEKVNIRNSTSVESRTTGICLRLARRFRVMEGFVWKNEIKHRDDLRFRRLSFLGLVTCLDPKVSDLLSMTLPFSILTALRNRAPFVPPSRDFTIPSYGQDMNKIEKRPGRC